VQPVAAAHESMHSSSGIACFERSRAFYGRRSLGAGASLGWTLLVFVVSLMLTGVLYVFVLRVHIKR